MSFRDDLKADLDIFVESEEFAEFVTLDGVTLRAQVTTSTQKMSGNETRNFDGLHGDFVTLFFKTSDYVGKKQRIPRQGEWCYFNGVRYDVTRCFDTLGITKLELSAYRQNTLRQHPYRGANPYETA